MFGPDVYDDAADYLEKYGWVQDAYTDEPGVEPDEPITGRPACALSALSVAIGHPVEWDAVVQEWILHQSCSYWGIGEISDVATWNDDPDRTKQEVLDTLRAAAKEARKLEDAN